MGRRLRAVLVAACLTLAVAPTAGATTTTWRLMTVPTSTGRGYGEPACADATHCWVPFATVSAAGILATVDAGHSWFTGQLPARVNVIDGISCSSITVCAAVGFDQGPQGTPRAVALHTTNGGRQWALATLPSVFVPTTGTWTRLDTVNCRSTRECVAMGAGPAPPARPVTCGAGCTYVPGPTDGTVALWALTSTDGGATWSASVVENSQPDEAYQIACTTTTTCAAVGFGFASCPPGQRCGAHGLAFYYDATAPTPWRLVPVPTGIFSVDSLSCPTASLCFAVGSTGDAQSGNGVVLRSLNGGRTWQRLVAPGGSNGIQSISCVSASTCVAAGGRDAPRIVLPTVFLTTNGGATWSDETVASVEFTGEVACPLVNFCVLTGAVSLGPTGRGLVLSGSA